MIEAGIDATENTTEVLEKKLAQIIKQNYRPVAIMHSFKSDYAFGADPYFILLEKERGVSDASLKNDNYKIDASRDPQLSQIEYKFVRSWRNSSFREKIGELAQQGFRLKFVGVKMALMFRENEDKTPVSYQWINTEKKEFLSDTFLLAKQGSVFKTVAPVYDKGDYLEKILIFEQVLAEKTRSYYDFKIVKLSDSKLVNRLPKTNQRDLSTSWETSLFMLEQSIKEGYTFSDLFYSNGTNVILLRAKQ